MNFIDLPAVRTAQGTIRMPGSKSISNRILLLAALADGSTDVRDLLISDDTARMLDALHTLGVTVFQIDANHHRVQGLAGRFPFASPLHRQICFWVMPERLFVH